MGLDFRLAEHLPNLRRGRALADPAELPRQRRGRTPQMHGRYPDYDVLENAEHWDEVTRQMVLARVHDVPAIRFFDARQVATLAALCDVLTAQDAEPRIPIVNFVDEKLHQGELDGYQYFDMPDDREVWRIVARGLDEQAQMTAGVQTFAAATPRDQVALVGRFADGELHGGVWSQLNVKRAFSVVMRSVLSAFYSHPWAWNEIGFGGPAYPRGYSRFGSPHLQSAERESWEGREVFDRDPQRQVREPAP